MRKYFVKLIRLVSKCIKKDKKLITLIYRGYSGSNISPIIEELNNDKYKSYKVKIIFDGKAYSDFKAGKISKLDLYKKRLIKYKYILKSNLLITTHGFYRLRNDNKMLNLWHGTPLKAMSLMNKAETDKVGYIKDDYFLSTSDFYNTIMNACFGIRAKQYFIAGYPRNDYLFNQEGVSNLELLVERPINGKVILFMPTYRDKERKEKKDSNIFGFETFDFTKFNIFLEENNLLLILKLHPNEEKLLCERYLNHINSRIILIKSEDLEKHKMDFYKVINAIDLLITDYSSIYFDYLLLDRPIIFTPADYETYKEGRGFLLEPYDFWTPGAKCLEQNSLQDEIIKSLDNPHYYSNERRIIKNIIHKYQDDRSTERVMSLIEEIMEN